MQTIPLTLSSLKATIYSNPQGFTPSWLKSNITNRYGVYINRSIRCPDYFRIGSGGANRARDDDATKTGAAGCGKGLPDRIKPKMTGSPNNLTEALYPWVPVWILQIEGLPSRPPDRYMNCYNRLMNCYNSLKTTSFTARPKDQIAYKVLACEHLLFGSFAQAYHFTDNSILEFKPPYRNIVPSPQLKLDPETPPFGNSAIQDENAELIKRSNSLITELTAILSL